MKLQRAGFGPLGTGMMQPWLRRWNITALGGDLGASEKNGWGGGTRLQSARSSPLPATKTASAASHVSLAGCR